MQPNNYMNDITEKTDVEHIRHKSWHRILLLIIAITIHNIPGLYKLHLGQDRDGWMYCLFKIFSTVFQSNQD